jgi:hypothetical protein
MLLSRLCIFCTQLNTRHASAPGTSTAASTVSARMDSYPIYHLEASMRPAHNAMQSADLFQTGQAHPQLLRHVLRRQLPKRARVNLPSDPHPRVLEWRRSRYSAALRCTRVESMPHHIQLSDTAGPARATRVRASTLNPKTRSVPPYLREPQLQKAFAWEVGRAYVETGAELSR